MTDTDHSGTELDAIRVRLGMATPGPWVIGSGSEIPDCGPPIFWVSPASDLSNEATIATLDTGEHDNEANADFIANAPADIAFLLSRLSAIRKETIEECAKVADERFAENSKTARSYTTYTCEEDSRRHREAVASSGTAAVIAARIRALAGEK